MCYSLLSKVKNGYLYSISVEKDILLEGPTSNLSSLFASIQPRHVLFYMYANLFLNTLTTNALII